MTAQRRRNLIVAVLLLLPFVAVGVASRVAVPRMADTVTRALRDVARVIQAARPRPVPKRASQVVASSNDVVVAPDAGALPVAGEKGARVPVVPGAPAGSGGAVSPVVGAPVGPVHIGADAVQRAIDDEGRSIRARTTRGPDGRPAGARVTGVNGAGLGLRDGDVIIAVDGKPTMDDDAATDAALSAVARGASVLHATLTRDGQPFEVVLELPLAPAKAGNSPARR